MSAFSGYWRGPTQRIKAAKLSLPNGKPTDQARTLLRSMQPSRRGLALARAKEIATSQNRAYVTAAMVEQADREVWG